MKSLIATAGFALVALSVCATGCGSSDKPVKDLGDMQVGAYTVHLEIEGDTVSAGNVTQFVVKPTAGGKPDKVTGWVGVMSGDGSVKKDGVYDSGDGDFDDDVTAPNPIPAGSMYWFQLTTGDHVDTASVAY